MTPSLSQAEPKESAGAGKRGEDRCGFDNQLESPRSSRGRVVVRVEEPGGTPKRHLQILLGELRIQLEKNAGLVRCHRTKTSVNLQRRRLPGHPHGTKTISPEMTKHQFEKILALKGAQFEVIQRSSNT